jgi:hypothetical protein
MRLSHDLHHINAAHQPKISLSSQALGTTLHYLAVLMMEEVSGWAKIFRLKSVESH